MNEMNLEQLLTTAASYGASDLHLIAGIPPAFRINGEIILADLDAVDGGALSKVVMGLLNEDQREKLHRDWELCVSMPHVTVGRVRATIYQRNGSPEMSLRICNANIPSREELGLPKKIEDLARCPNGLVLITGPTGSGKTTTLNYMIDLINSERRCKIVTIEDPVEHVHHNNRALVVQLEVMTDTHSFSRALTHVLRQDPDVIVIGEMRDLETMATAITAADTGHLVLATVHSPNAVQTLERIVGVYEGSMQRQIMIQLANSLQGIISQVLLPSVDRDRRVMAYELLLASSSVRSIIREGNLEQLVNVLQTSAREGMVLMDNCLRDLYAKCLISYDAMITHARHPDQISKDSLRMNEESMT